MSPSLRAQDALTYEVGARGGVPGLAFEAAAFLVDLENELIARENAESRTFFVNAGRSRRLGAEAFARWTPWRPLELTGAYTWLRATFEDDEGDRRGKAIPGLPEHRVFGRVRYDDGMLLAAAELEWVDARPVDDAGSARASPHTLAELRAGLRVSSGPWQGELSFGVRNLFDVRWVDNVRINAFGGRFYEPGPPLHVFGVLTLRHGAPASPVGAVVGRVDDGTPGRRVDRPLALSRSHAYPAAE